MADIMILLIKMDQFNLTEIDFVRIFSMYLDRLNYDSEIFVNLLVECESFKVMLYKINTTSNKYLVVNVSAPNVQDWIYNGTIWQMV